MFKIFFERGLHALEIGILSEDVYVAISERLLEVALEMGYEKVTESLIEE